MNNHVQLDTMKPLASSLSQQRDDVNKDTGYRGPYLFSLLKGVEAELAGNVYMQICRSYEVLCEDAEVAGLFKFGNPMFLPCIFGPYLMVCGAIKRENAQAEPFTPSLPMFPGRGMGILKIVDSTATTGKLPEPHLVPHSPDNGLLRFGECFSVKLQKTRDERQHPVVVNFVYNYTTIQSLTVSSSLLRGELASWTCHAGLGRLPFEGCVGGYVELDTVEGKLVIWADRRMVHVNLRPKNITVQVDEKGDTVLCKDKPILSIIDFDWAGVADEVP
ncbi:hypothetical protein CPB86DRAFT_795682 [Serendipita vermifera]|nr:hypothetical protein CPB86DRAFT_795682 [Serendipita vermifera]